MSRPLRFLTILFISLNSIHAKGQKELREHLDNADFFRLQESLNKYQYRLDLDVRLYFCAFADNAFNRNELSNRRIDSFLHIRNNDWYEKEIAELLQVQRDNYIKTFRYREAAATGKLLLSRYTAAIDTGALTDIANSNKIWDAVSSVPPQTIDVHTDLSIPIHKDKSNLWNVAVAAGSFKDDFIFDTGANISTVSASVADKMKLHRIHTSFYVNGFQGVMVKSDIGIADSINIGGLVVRHVIFMIMPDNALNFPQISYTIHGIIGFPVINAMKEVQLYKKGVLVIPARPAPLPGYMPQNLALHGLYPMIRARTNNDWLNFHFDTGAGVTDMFNTYFDRYSRWITRRGKQKITEFGSAGGSRKMEAYELKNFHLYIGGKDATLSAVTILTLPIKSDPELVYGNIGLDVVEQFDEMVINWESMYVQFR
ncbi:aspartyl protease family protein [Chitinophagaceae bacterium MMS25-I14]